MFQSYTNRKRSNFYLYSKEDLHLALHQIAMPFDPEWTTFGQYGLPETTRLVNAVLVAYIGCNRAYT